MGACTKHKPLNLGNGRVIFGGRAAKPAWAANIYVGLHDGVTPLIPNQPWRNEQVEMIYFPIKDFGIPQNARDFKDLIAYLCGAIAAGKRVHVGCIGGHGRTGMVLSAVVAWMLREKNAIQYVRKHYCESAVETGEQAAFLAKHFGVSNPGGGKKYTSAWDTPWKGGTGSATTADFHKDDPIRKGAAQFPQPLTGSDVIAANRPKGSAGCPSLTKEQRVKLGLSENPKGGDVVQTVINGQMVTYRLHSKK